MRPTNLKNIDPSLIDEVIKNESRGVCVFALHSLRPPLSRGDSEEGEQGPSHVVVVKIVLLPLPLLSFNFLSSHVQQVFTPKGTQMHTHTAFVVSNDR